MTTLSIVCASISTLSAIACWVAYAMIKKMRKK